MSHRITVPGIELGTTPTFARDIEDLALDDGLVLDSRGEVEVDLSTRAEGAETGLEGEVTDVVEVWDEDGYVEFATVAELERASAVDRGRIAGGGDIDLIRAMSLLEGPQLRGQKQAAKTVKRYGVKYPPEVAKRIDVMERAKGKLIDLTIERAVREAMRWLLRWAERPAPDDADDELLRKRPKVAGLYQVTRDLLIDPANRFDTSAPPAPDGKPYLMLIHGTASHTENGFNGMRKRAEWYQMFDHFYRGRVLALEHRTLSVSPIENALDLASSAPEGAALHLISHSRGGLVGDLVSLAAHAASSGRPLDPEILQQAGREEDEIELLVRLFDTVKDRGLSVDRYVRAGCPARGTILASKRLDQYAKWLLWAIGKVPLWAGTGVFTLIRNIILTTLEQRMSTEIAPGLEAQMPESPFIRFLNRNAEPIGDGLGVLAADVEGKGLKGRAAVLAADLFYRQDHDFVVDTRAMYQGVRRDKAYYSFNKGHAATHFTYFSDDESRHRMLQWLIHDDGPPKGFVEVDRDAPKLVEVRSRAAASDQSAVVLVPGLMGSPLLVGDDVLWPSADRLALVTAASLTASNADASVGTALTQAYHDLDAGLARAGFDVVACPWDWRGGLSEAAATLNDVLVEQLALRDRQPEGEEKKPVHVLAHSIGGLVARLFLTQHPETWERVRDSGGRMVLSGCPTGGTYRAVQLAGGDDELVLMLDMIDAVANGSSSSRLFRGYQSVLAALPASGDSWWDQGWWSETFGRRPRAEALTEAREVQEHCAHKAPNGVINVAGYGAHTPSRFDAASGVYSGGDDGDGVVTTESAAPAEEKAYFTRLSHLGLIKTDTAIRGYAELLRRGGTSAFETASPIPAPRRDADLSPVPGSRGRILYPTTSDLARAALGPEVVVATEAADVLEIEVVHGNLKYSGLPVAVGHYEGSTLDGAEGAINGMMDNRLVNRNVLGIYPGRVGDFDLILPTEESRPPGALIIGLGEIGDLTPVKVTRGTTEMALKYALDRLERRRGELKERKARGRSGDAQESEGWVSAAFSSLLIGTSGLNALSVVNSMAAIVKGVDAANRILEQRDLINDVRIDRVQFIELYEDRAIEAAHAAHELAAEQIVRNLRAAPRMRVIKGGKPGRPDRAYDEGQWRRIVVESIPGGGADPSAADAQRRDLVFTSLGGRARAEQAVSATHRGIIDRLVARAVNDPAAGDAQVHNTLFELLLPNVMKGQARETDNLLFVLAPDAAQYPWEMLSSRTFGEAAEPLATQVGILRRLKTEEFRQHVQMAAGNKALVIGDPPAAKTDPVTGQRMKFARLPGAAREAEAVADLLRAEGFDVTSIIGGRDEDDLGVEILNALFKDDYRIIHVAAHGDYDEAEPLASGVMIGDDVALSAPVIGQLQTTPALVFLNCCHLGRMDAPDDLVRAGARGRFNVLAASISQQLIRDGVRAIVAAGWAVDDLAARDFATSLYTKVIAQGYPFGEAIHRARSDIRKKHTLTNTWGAYQCYGDPGFRITATGSVPRTQARLVARTELVNRAKGLADWAEGATADEAGQVVGELQALLDEAKTVPDSWSDGAFSQAVGDAYSGIGRFDESIYHYREAKRKWGGGEAFQLLRTLANNQSRAAANLHFLDKRDRAAQKKIRDYVDEAEELLAALLDVEASASDVHCHYAAHMKRKDQIYGGKKALVSAAEHYRQGHLLHLEQAGVVSTWPAMNWAGLRVLGYLLPDLEIPEHSGDPSISELLDDCVTHAQRTQAEQGPSFWDCVTIADAAVYRALLERKLGARASQKNADATLGAIVALYAAAGKQTAAERFRKSVYDQLRFFRLKLDGKREADRIALLQEKLADPEVLPTD